MAEYTKIKTARTIICDFCNQLYSDEPCEPADCDWLRMLEEDAVPVPHWISVKDRLPEPDENPVIAGCEPFNVVFMAWYHSKTKRWELPSKIACEVTHWMLTSSLPRMDGAE